jgi:predicted RecB family endonuclease
MVITDDKPNANNMRIPKEEFASVIKTAIYMPIKMAEGKISEGHDGAKPIGSIAHLVENGDQVVALAALWNKERSEDVEFIKNRYENGQSIDVSWELNYDVTASTKDDDGILELKNIEMNAVTIVGLPSYMGRTGVTALASKDENDEGEDEAMDTIKREDHEKIVAGLTEKVDELTETLSAKSEELEKAQAQLEELTSTKAELEEIKPEYEELKEFKAEIDAANERKEKLSAIRGRFEEAGIKVTDEYMEEKEEKLLGMEEAALDFFIQELVSFREEQDDEEAEASLSITSKLPDINVSDKEVESDDLVTYLRSLDEKKK